MSYQNQKRPGREMADMRSAFAQSAYGNMEGGDGEEVELDENVPVPRSRPLGRMASRRNLSAAKRHSSVRQIQRGVQEHKSGDSVTSAAASLTSTAGRGSLTAPVAVAADPPRNAEENYLRQSMLRNVAAGGGGRGSGSGIGGSGFDMSAIQAALKEDEALEASDSGFDDREVLEQYRIMAQHEAMLRVKANTGFDLEDYEKRRKTTGNEAKDKKEMFGGGKKPRLGLPQPHHVISLNSSNGGMSSPPILTLYHHQGGNSESHHKFLEEQKRKERALPEFAQGEQAALTQIGEGDHGVRCWGCKQNLRVNYAATLVQCPDCGTVSQARKRN